MHAIINVRMSSSRLPGKTLMPLGEKTVLDCLWERVNRATCVDQIIVNTSVNQNDDAIVAHCEKMGYEIHRGSEDDVLGRMADACRAFNIGSFVEVFGDCPLIDYRIVDQAATTFNANKLDFYGNDLKTTYPPGFEVEVVNAAAFLRSERECHDPEIREHGTLYMRLNKDKFRVENFEYDVVLDEIPHLTLDTKEDYQLISRVFDACFDLYGFSFSLENVLEQIGNNPHWLNANKAIPRKWKQYRE